MQMHKLNVAATMLQQHVSHDPGSLVASTI